MSQLGQVSLLLALSWRGCVFLQESTAVRERYRKRSLPNQTRYWTHIQENHLVSPGCKSINCLIVTPFEL